MKNIILTAKDIYAEDVVDKIVEKEEVIEILFCVNLSDEELIDRFELEDHREPTVNIYVGLVKNSKVLKYIKTDYHTCDGEHWYKLATEYKVEEKDMLYSEAFKCLRQESRQYGRFS